MCDRFINSQLALEAEAREALPYVRTSYQRNHSFVADGTVRNLRTAQRPLENCVKHSSPV
jgi:hypothetical protein